MMISRCGFIMIVEQLVKQCRRHYDHGDCAAILLEKRIATAINALLKMI